MTPIITGIKIIIGKLVFYALSNNDAIKRYANWCQIVFSRFLEIMYRFLPDSSFAKALKLIITFQSKKNLNLHNLDLYKSFTEEKNMPYSMIQEVRLTKILPS